MVNPNALVFWLFSALVGYLITGTVRGAIAGLTISIGISLIVDLFLSMD